MKGSVGLDEARLRMAFRQLADEWSVPTSDDLRRMAAVATQRHQASVAGSFGSFRLLRSRGRLIAAVAAVLLLIGAGGATAYVALIYAPTPEEQQVLHNKPDLDTLAVERQVHIGGTTWTIVGYDSSAGYCLQAYGALDGHPEWEGKLGGCGEPDTPLVWGAGGLELGGQMFTVTWGQAPASATTVEVSLTDGSILRDSGPLDGVWIVVLTGDLRGGPDLLEMRALDAEGRVVGKAALPQLGAEREAAVEQAKRRRLAELGQGEHGFPDDQGSSGGG